MAVYYINTYDIIDPEKFKAYGPGVRPILARYGAEVLAMDLEAIVLEGSARKMNAIIKFPSEESAIECYNDPEYQPIKAIRLASVANCSMILVKEFIRPANR
jgi:uncharacterized protein (DUF1330 family)